jgi:hypothetical protein
VSSLERVLGRLERVRKAGTGFEARCPAHDDRVASLSVAEGGEGRVLVKCHAGCPLEAVLEAAGLAWADLFSPNGRRTGEPEAVYLYVSELGEPLFEVVRFEGKRFRQRRPGAERWGLGKARRVLYRSDRLFAAIENGEADGVYVVEGEKDVHAAERAGALATTCPMGAGKWRPEYAEQLRGARRAVVVADRDEPGLAHAREVAASLEGVVPDVAIVQAREGKDLADHLAAGHALDELVPLAGPATVDQVVDTFQRWLYMPDARPLVAVLGAYAANRLQGERVWLIVVGPPGDGKSEILRALRGVPEPSSSPR